MLLTSGWGFDSSRAGQAHDMSQWASKLDFIQAEKPHEETAIPVCRPRPNDRSRLPGVYGLPAFRAVTLISFVAP